MKRLVVFLLIVLNYHSTAHSQIFIPDSLIKSNKITFKVDEQSVYNLNNKLHGKKQKTDIDPRLIFVNIVKGTILTSFTQTFTDARLKELTKERGIVLILDITPDGKVAEVEFRLLNKNTLLSAIEIENLEINLKKNVSFKLDSALTKDGVFFGQSIFVTYQGILERNMPEF